MNALVPYGLYQHDPVEDGYRRACYADRGVIDAYGHLALRMFCRMSHAEMSYAELAAVLGQFGMRPNATTIYCDPYYDIETKPIPLRRKRRQPEDK